MYDSIAFFKLVGERLSNRLMYLNSKYTPFSRQKSGFHKNGAYYFTDNHSKGIDDFGKNPLTPSAIFQTERIVKG